MGVFHKRFERSLWWKRSERRVCRQVRTMTGHSIIVLSVAFSPDGKRIVCGSFQGIIRIWDAATGAEVRSHGGSTLWSEDCVWC